MKLRHLGLILSFIGVSIITASAAMNANAADFTTKYQVAFTYEGEAFVPEKWSPSSRDLGNGVTDVTYTSPDGKLRLKVTYKAFNDFPVVEIRPVLECVGSAETGIVDGFRSLNLDMPCSSNGIRIRRTTGSASQFSDFSRHDVLLQRRHECNECSMSCSEGRSSAWLPYFGIDFSGMSGLEVAIGWTGDWKADFKYNENFLLAIGMGRKTHFKMLPGESFRMPYTVIYEREGKSVEDGLVEFHRFVIEHKSPRDAQGELFKPILPLTGSGGNKTDDNMLKVLNRSTELFNAPFDTFWIDAGWYGAYHETPQDSNCGPFWSRNVGNWTPNTFSHPDGNLKKVSDAAHAKGMKFLLWFEPERATINAPIVHEHPEYFLRPKNNPSDEGFLLNLGDPAALEWIISEVSRNIIESGVDIYRQDFNMDPRPCWEDADTPDRMGVTEIKHINGLYAFWDELHRRFPDMMFENCASGGRRMDIEMMSRAHSYCRDDAQMAHGCEEMVQNITLNSTPYIPFTGGETFAVSPLDTYGWLSCLGAGTVFTPTDFQGMILTREPGQDEIDWFNTMLGISDRVRTLFSGDFYNLTEDVFDSSDIFCGYQFNKGDEGFFLIFRRQDCQRDTYRPNLRGIDAEAKYLVEEFEGKTRKMKGSALAGQTLGFEAPRSYKLVFYRKIATR